MRLIDADALCRSLNDWQYGEFARAGHEVEYNLIDKVLNGICAAPAIDAVPVVRCADCKYWKLSEYNTMGIHVCKRFSGVRGERDFCSRGERKDNADN